MAKFPSDHQNAFNKQMPMTGETRGDGTGGSTKTTGMGMAAAIEPAKKAGAGAMPVPTNPTTPGSHKTPGSRPVRNGKGMASGGSPDGPRADAKGAGMKNGDKC